MQQEKISQAQLPFAAVAVALSAASFLVLTLIKHVRGRKHVEGAEARRLPPGPRPWPLLGNLVHLARLLHYRDAGNNGLKGKKPRPRPLHAALASLSRVYGPLRHLRLGCQQIVVASSADAAREVLRVLDRSLSSRAIPAAYRVLKYEDHSMVWSNDDEPRWRRLRGLTRSHLLGTSKVEAHAGAREKKAWEMVEYLMDEAKFGREARLADVAFKAVLDMFGQMMVSGQDMSGGFREGDKGAVDWDLKKDFVKGLQLGEEPNLEDLFPSVFGGWDLQGIRKEVMQGVRRCFDGWGRMVNRRKEKLLKLQKQEKSAGHERGADNHDDGDFLMLS